MSSISSANKTFSVHPALIYTIITKQASGVHKALLELAMNSVDAGATEIHLNITEEGFVFQDNGSGFKDEEQIISCFETFGTPHVDGDAEYGRYRLGRAQLLCYAKTVWHTKNMCMQVDLKDALDANIQDVPLGYELSTVSEYFSGCKISGLFYDHLNIGTVDQIGEFSNEVEPESIGYVIPAFAKMVKYLPVDLFINSVKVTKSIKDVFAIERNDEALFVLDQKYTPNQDFTRPRGVVNVYNKGAYAYQIKSKYYDGDVTSLQNIDLNIARNSAKTICPVAKAISKKISQLDQRVDYDYLKSRNANTSTQLIDTARFVEGFWRGVLGFRSFDLQDFQEMYYQKVFTQGNDTKFSFADIFSQLDTRRKKLIQQVQAPNYQIYYYNDAVLNSILSNERDKLTIKNGMIPSIIFPDSCFLQSVNHQAGIPASIIDDWISKVRRNKYTNHDVLDLRVQQLEELGTDFSSIHSDQVHWLEIMYSHLLKHLLFFSGVISKLNQGSYHYAFYNESSNVFLNNANNPILSFFDSRLLSVGTINVSEFMSSVAAKKAKLTPYEKLVCNALNTVVGYPSIRYITEECGKIINQEVSIKKSKDINVEVLQGDEVGVMAWTNGYDMIAFEEKYFKKCAATGDFSSLILTLLHELSHNDNSADTLTHGASFYFVFKTMAERVLRLVLLNFLDSLTRSVMRKCQTKEGIQNLEIPVDVLKYLIERQLNKITAKAG